jgi:chromosome segregation protein
MKLERVSISGFKSFGDKVELTFHEGVTVIVGPNGCGKSNISDAVGWVLGEQSAKSLRGQSMGDVIFNGSQARPPLSLAEVSLQVSQVAFPVPAPAEPANDSGPGAENGRSLARGEVVVTRRLDRAGKSEYLIDGVSSRLRDIQELFMGTGVGTTAYAIIEQGKIGLILSSKPTDRRTLIEEAAGITKYKSRRRAAELKLEAAQQNLFRVNDIVYEITRQMNSLKRQAGKARRYRRLRDAMERLSRIVAVNRSRLLEARLAETRKRLKAISDEELRRTTSLTTTETYLERARLREVERGTDLSDVRDAVHALELSIERAEQTREREKRLLVELDQRRRELEVEAAELESRRGPVLERVEAREKEEGALTRELESRERDAEAQQGRLKEASSSLAEIETRIEERRGEIVLHISKIAALNNFLQSVAANAEKVTGELLAIDEELREAEAERSRLESALAEARQEVDRERGERDVLASERESLERNLETAGRALALVEAEIASAKEELSSLSARRASLLELVSARAHFGSGARLVLTRGAERGVRVLGSVADALDVEAGLERAAEAFLDAALQRVLVEDETDVERASALLGAEEEAGRSELLVQSLAAAAGPDLSGTLERLRERGMPGLVGLLSDGLRLIAPERRLALPDAIVVETFAHGLRCYREAPSTYVSLTGEVISPPGVVAIGPGGVSSGLLATRREIRELESTISLARERLDESSGRRVRMQSELDEDGRRLDATRDRLHALEKTLVGLDHRARGLEEEKERAARKREVLESELSRAEAEKTALAAKRGEMGASLEEEEAKKARAESSLGDLRASMSERRESVESLQANASEERSHLAALRERRDAVRLDVERLREGLSELTSRVEACRREQASRAEREVGAREAERTAEEELRAAVSARAEKIAAGRALEEEVDLLRRRIETTGAALKVRRRELEAVREKRSSEEVVLAREESDRNHLQESFESAHGTTLSQAASRLSPEDLARGDDETQAELADLKARLDAIGPVNPMADEEYRELETRHEFVTHQRQDLLDSIESTETAITRIDRTSRQRFKEAFEAINQEFGLTFKQLFGGGGAGLRLVDEEDLLESGIDIIAQPPGKKLQNVLLLSGGEKAMTAIALLFAIFRYRPSPFCLLDEVDAPLDDANIGRFLAMLRELRETTQFIIITHSRKTMEMADQLYGVTMEEPGISKLVSVSMVAGRPEPVEALAT